MTALYLGLRKALAAKSFALPATRFADTGRHSSSARTAIVPPARQRYLAEIADTVRGYHKTSGEQVTLARELQQLRETGRMLTEAGADAKDITPLVADREERFDARARKLIERWRDVREA